jgi:large subunit ribosomal protein L17
MRHRKHTTRLGRDSAHRQAMLINLSKELIIRKRVVTTVQKAKQVKKVFEPIITLSKVDCVNNRRKIAQKLRLRNNTLTPKQIKQVKEGDKSCYNTDRKVLTCLYSEFSEKYQDRPGGYTRIVRMSRRIGDNAEMCILECV